RKRCGLMPLTITFNDGPCYESICRSSSTEARLGRGSGSWRCEPRSSLLKEVMVHLDGNGIAATSAAWFRVGAALIVGLWVSAWAFHGSAKPVQAVASSARFDSAKGAFVVPSAGERLEPRGAAVAVAAAPGGQALSQETAPSSAGGVRV